MSSAFRGTIEFFMRLGVYDVVLPFLLVYSITYAILEKTEVLGKDKRSINAIVAFTMAFFVVASTKIVAIISKAVANIILVIIILFSFLLLASMLHTGDKPFELSDGTKKLLIGAVFLVVLLIFFYSFGWLNLIIKYLSFHWDSEFFLSIVLLGMVIGVVGWISSSSKAPDKKD